MYPHANGLSYLGKISSVSLGGRNSLVNVFE